MTRMDATRSFTMRFEKRRRSGLTALRNADAGGISRALPAEKWGLDGSAPAKKLARETWGAIIACGIAGQPRRKSRKGLRGKRSPMLTHLEKKTVSAAGAARLLGLGKNNLQLSHNGRLLAKSLYGRLPVRLRGLNAFVTSLPDARQAVQQ
jgi:hypothetical protein